MASECTVDGMMRSGVSIVIPAYNEEKFLPDTLLAARAAQDHLLETLGLKSEVVVVNNASTDQTSEVALSCGAIVIDHTERNISSVRNAGIRGASFDLIVAIDADCFLPKDSLVQVWRVMQEGETIGGAFAVKVLTDRMIVKVAAFAIQKLVQAISGIQGAMFYFWRDDALSFGGFSEQHLVAEDSVFANSLRKLGHARGKRFLLLESVEIGTLDRKELPLRGLVPIVLKVAKAYVGRGANAKQSKDELKYWYEPKR